MPEKRIRSKDWTTGVLLGLLALATWVVPAFAATPPPLRAPGDRELDPYALSGETTVYEGEAIVWTESDHQVLVALDQADGAGELDGLADHVFSFHSARPIEHLYLRDPEAWIEKERGQLAVVLRSHQQILRFALEGSRHLIAFPDQDQYAVRTLLHGTWIVKYSDAAAHRVSFEDVARRGKDALSEGAGETIGPWYVPPSDGSGSGSCQGTCSIQAGTCTGGTCSATCSSGYCAYCECHGGTSPTCFCGR